MTRQSSRHQMAAARSLLAIVGSAVAFIPLEISVAATVVDQGYNTSAAGNNTIIAARFETAQTFTVALTGVMTSADVKLGRFPFTPFAVSDIIPLTLDIRRTVDGVPVESNSGPDILGSATILAASIPSSNGINTAWIDFDLPDFPVTSGEVLAIVMRTPAGTTQGLPDDAPFVWSLDNPGAYLRGRVFVRGSSSGLSTWSDYQPSSFFPPLSNADHSFRTFVSGDFQVSPVPEPGLAFLFSVALGGLLARLRWVKERHYAKSAIAG